MADAPDSKSGAHWVCGFKSRPRHHIRIQRLLSKTKKPFVLAAISSLYVPTSSEEFFWNPSPFDGIYDGSYGVTYGVRYGGILLLQSP